MDDNKILIAQGENPVYINPNMLNRHGLITGVTGSGKTITLKTLAEKLSDIGVPVFLADVKGDLSGLAKEGVSNKNVDERVSKFNLSDFKFKKYPVHFWDVFEEKGIPVRTTVSDIGPQLLGRILDLNDTQSSVLNVVFKIADDQGLLLLDLKDLKSMLSFVSEHRKELAGDYGNLSSQSIGAIQRALVSFEEEGGEKFLNEPMLDIDDWIITDENGNGYINVLDCVELYNHPKLYSTFLLWMLSELYENLPEVGDLDQPKIVFFFDEAHLLFENQSPELLEKIEQIVRLIRSKGVGVFFISQSPEDIPDDVLAQLNNKIQHTLHAYTPKEQKAIKAAAESFRPNENFDTKEVIGELGIGEALISTLDNNGTPTVVERAFILPPQSFIGPLTDQERIEIINNDRLYPKYKDSVDRESAYEIIQVRMNQEKLEQQQKELEKQAQKQAQRQPKRRGRPPMSPTQKFLNSTVQSFGRELGRSLMRGLFGNLKR